MNLKTKTYAAEIGQEIRKFLRVVFAKDKKKQRGVPAFSHA